MDPGTDFLHILVATLAALAAGFIWYLPPVFGNKWRMLVKEYTGMEDDDLKPEIFKLFVKWFFVVLINAIVLFLLIDRLDIQSRLSAIKIAAGLWLGFGLSFSSWPVIFARQRQSLWLINNGAFLFMQIVMAVILVAWR